MPTFSIDIAGGSDIGRERSENQDHYLVAELRRQLIVRSTDVQNRENEELFGCQEGTLLVVADGMGGHHGGELASRTAVEAAARYVLDMMHWFLKLSTGEEQDFVDELSLSLRSIQEKIWSMGAATAGSERRMGTTVTMAYLLFPKMYLVHAGDSRCYLLRDGELRQLTTDHTVAQQLVDSGEMSENDPAVKRWKHVLWNCVGGGDERVRPEAFRTRLNQGDRILLCSDGLTGAIDNQQILSILTSHPDSRACVSALIDAANAAGGHDNISAIVGRVESASDCDEADVDSTLETIVIDDPLS